MPHVLLKLWEAVSPYLAPDLSSLWLPWRVADLDRANLANAYVSGMKEALNMTGHDLNTVNSLFTVGYTIGMIPQNLLLQVVP